jgi:hypothetical protein
MRLSRRARLITVGALCALAGAAAGIAGSAAAPSGKSTPNPREHRFGFFGRMPPGAGMRAFGGPPVHTSAVVPNHANGFDTITGDDGTFQSYSGGVLSITEGTKSATYQVAKLTIPANATVVRNGASAKIIDLAAGDFVHVTQGPQGTFVFALDAAHQQQEKQNEQPGPRGFRGPRRPDGAGPDGPGGGPGGGGPGPAVYQAPGAPSGA